jgi:hypothetical protein
VDLAPTLDLARVGSHNGRNDLAKPKRTGDSAMLPLPLLSQLAALQVASPAAGPAQGQGELTRAQPPISLLAPEASTAVAARVALLEGPACDSAGNLFFSDIFANRIYRMTPEGAIAVFRADSGRTDGNTFDARGRLISCERGRAGPWQAPPHRPHRLDDR